MAHLAFLLLLLSQAGLSVQMLARRAQEDLQAGRLERARQELQAALKKSPEDPLLWTYLGMADAGLNELDPAIAAFQKVISLTPNRAQAYFNLGVLFGRKGEAARALQAYEKGLAIAPDDPGANQNYALLLMAAGRYRDSIAPLLKLKRARGSDLPVRVALIEAYLKGGMKAEGERDTEELLDSPIPSTSDKLKLAQVLIEDKQPGTAQEVLENAVATAPASAEAHGALGFLFSQMDQYEAAVRELGRAAQLAPDSARYSMGLAETLLLWKHNATALEFLLAVKDRFQSLPEYQYKLALAYYNLHQYPTAIKELEKLAARQRELDLVQYFLGNSYAAMGEMKDAEKYYRRAIALNPKEASYYASLAALLRKMSDQNTDQAIPYLEKALQLDQRDVKSRLLLGLCYEEKRDLVKATALFEEVTRLKPDLVAAHVALARTYYHRKRKQDGDRERATVALLEAKEQARASRAASRPEASQP